MNNPYALQFADKALQALEKIEKRMAAQIVTKLERLAEYADDLSHHSLSGQWSGYYRLRIGSYRVIHDLDRNERIIYVERIGHRREIYDE